MDIDGAGSRLSTFILDPVYNVYIFGWFVPAKDPMYITFEGRFPHKVKYTRAINSSLGRRHAVAEGLSPLPSGGEGGKARSGRLLALSGWCSWWGGAGVRGGALLYGWRGAYNLLPSLNQ